MDITGGIIQPKREYVKEYDETSEIVEVWQGKNLPPFLCKLPRKPHPDEIIRTDDNKFHHIDLEECQRWILLPDEERSKLVAREWHRRIHGVWWQIKDRLVYIPGKNYFFLNYWHLREGSNRDDGRPDFVYADTLFYYVLEECHNDKNCFGIIDLKCRRAHESSKGQSLIYELISRKKKHYGGMQSKNGTSVKKEYQNVVYGHESMVWFFKPLNQGSDKPQQGLVFRRPSKRITDKTEREKHGIYDEIAGEQTIKELGSEITFDVTREQAFDGRMLNWYTLDEFAKMEKQDMNPEDAWYVVKECLSKQTQTVIVGFALLLSTVEEINDEQLAIVRRMWDGSNPRERRSNGRTVTGLFRLFRPADVCGPWDEYGFTDRVANRKRILNEREELRKAKNWKVLAEEIRKYPLEIEDALTPSGTVCHFDIIKLKNRLNELIQLKAANDASLPVRGRLDWIVPYRSVHFTPMPDAQEDHPDAQFLISGRPDEPNKILVSGDGKIKPVNTDKFVIGLDPYDHLVEEATERHSKGAIRIKRKLDTANDVPPSDDYGHPNYLGRGTQTNRTVGTMVYRYKDPSELFEAAAKAAIYYGCQIHTENNKAGVEIFFREKGMQAFLFGTYNTGYSFSETSIIKQGSDALSIYVDNNINAEMHQEVIEELMTLQLKHMGKFDLGVACIYSEVADSIPMRKVQKLEHPIQIYKGFKQTPTWIGR